MRSRAARHHSRLAVQDSPRQESLGESLVVLASKNSCHVSAPTGGSSHRTIAASPGGTQKAATARLLVSPTGPATPATRGGMPRELACCWGDLHQRMGRFAPARDGGAESGPRGGRRETAAIQRAGDPLAARLARQVTQTSGKSLNRPSTPAPPTSMSRAASGESAKAGSRSTRNV